MRFKHEIWMKIVQSTPPPFQKFTPTDQEITNISKSRIHTQNVRTKTMISLRLLQVAEANNSTQ